MNILIRRTGAMGDVLLTTPIVARFRAEYGSDAIIDVHTGVPQVYAGTGYKNPHVTDINMPRAAGYDIVCELDGVYERDRKRHQVHAFMEAAFGDDEGDKTIRFPIAEPPNLGVTWDNVVSIHPAIAWPSRTFPAQWWQKVVSRLIALGFTVVALGTSRDHFLDQVVDTRSQLSLHQQAAVIAASKAFIASDSGLLTLAGATETPIVTMLTVTKPEYFLPYRHGELGWKIKAHTPDIECFGCSGDLGPVTYVACRRHDNVCITMFDPIAVADSTQGMLYD